VAYIIASVRNLDRSFELTPVTPGGCMQKILRICILAEGDG